MLSTTSKGFKKDDPNKKWVTKEQFNKVFPRGYRECNFFSKPVEFWAMNKEACWDWKQTALLDLTFKLHLQKNLQQTSIVGHSSDTKLFTELLNQNDEDLKNKSHNKKTSSHTINNNVNTVTDVLKNIISNSKKCYTCNNVCKCSKLLPNRSKNEMALLSEAQLFLPEIKLIDQFDRTSIISSLKRKNSKLSNYVLNNNDVSVTDTVKPNIFQNCYSFQNEAESELETIFYDNNVRSPMETANNIQSRPTTPLDNTFVTERASRQIIQDESTTDDNNEHENVLKYFYLKSIADIFQDHHEYDDDCVMDTGFNEIVYS